MRKNVFWLAAMAAAVSMTGCSLDEVVEKAEVRNIGFDAFANKSSRATKPADFAHNNFSVWGRYDKGSNQYEEVFTGKEVKWENDVWTYGTPIPWVVGKNYEFAAIAPYGVTNASYAYDSNTYTFGDVTVDLTDNNQVDYLVADVKENVQSTGGAVSFTFNHTLSQVDFKFVPQTQGDKAWKSNVKIKVKSFTLKTVVSVGDCSVAYTDLATPTKTVTWTNESTTADFAYTTELETSYTLGALEPTTESALSKPAWLVIPQEEGDRKLSITCDIYDTTKSDEVLIKENATAEVDIDTEWVTNTYYTYTVKIGTDILGENPYITFDVKEVKDWTPDTTNSIEVPSQNP